MNREADRLSRDLKKRHGLIHRAHSLAGKGIPIAGRDERVDRAIELYRPAVCSEHEHVLGRCTRRAIVCCNLSSRLLVLQQGADHRASHHNEQRYRERNANEHRDDYERAARSARPRRCFCGNSMAGSLSTKPLSLPGVGSGGPMSRVNGVDGRLSSAACMGSSGAADRRRRPRDLALGRAHMGACSGCGTVDASSSRGAMGAASGRRGTISGLRALDTTSGRHGSMGCLGLGAARSRHRSMGRLGLGATRSGRGAMNRLPRRWRLMRLRGLGFS